MHRVATFPRSANYSGPLNVSGKSILKIFNWINVYWQAIFPQLHMCTIINANTY